MSFVVHDRLLHLERNGQSINLFTRPLDDGRADVERNLLASALDTRVAIDCSIVPCAQTVSLKDCISVLVARGKDVSIEEGCDVTAGHVETNDDETIFSFGDPFTESRLVHLPEDRSAVNWTPCFDPASRSGFRLRVRPGLVLPAQVPENVPWTTLLSSERLCIRIGLSRESVVCLYRNGICVDREERNAPGLHLCIRGRPQDQDYVVDNAFDRVAFVQHLMDASTAMNLHDSRIVGDFLRHVSHLRVSLREHFRTTNDEYKDLLRLLQPEYAGFLDPEKLVKLAVRDVDVETLCLLVARRLFPSMKEVTGSLYGDMVDTLFVETVATLPVTKSVLGRLSSGGFFDGTEIEHCDTGIVVLRPRRLLCVPYDVDATDVTVAMAVLLRCGTDKQPQVDDWVLRAGVCNTQTFKECGPNDVLHAYRLVFQDDSVSFERDATVESVSIRDAHSIDEVALETIPFHGERRDRSRVAQLFPQLSRRLDLHPDPLVELRGRKLSAEWRMEDLDLGGDLSSLGMSILAALILGWWHGARARVFVSSLHTAVVGVWWIDDYRIIDPCASTENALTLAFGDLRPTGLMERKMAKGTFIEVKQRSKWHVAEVERVAEHHRSQSSRTLYYILLDSNIRNSVAFSSRTWRFMSRGDDDLDVVLRRYWKAKPPTDVAVPKPSIPWPPPAAKRRRSSESAEEGVTPQLDGVCRRDDRSLSQGHPPASG